MDKFRFSYTDQHGYTRFKVANGFLEAYNLINVFMDGISHGTIRGYQMQRI